MLRLIILNTLISLTLSEICDENTSIDITNGVHLPDGTIHHKGLIYSSPEYYTDNNNTVRGCVCQIKTCASKCCPLGYGYIKRKNFVRTIYDEFCKELPQDTFDPPVLDEYFHPEPVKAKEHFHFIPQGKPNCSSGEARVVMSQFGTEYHLRIDGRLYTEVKNYIPPWMLKAQGKYCVDTFIVENADGTQKTRLDALVCFKKDPDDNRQHLIITSSCMLISCVFILATVGVYGWLPELRNLHGRVLMSYLMCLFVAFAFLGTMQILIMLYKITQTLCVSFTIVIYFSLLSAFFWLNVMCFDIWWTFSGKRGVTREKMTLGAKFGAYALYAFGIPTVFTIILASLELSELPPHPLLPMIRRRGCFLNGTSRLFYLYGPIVVLWFANLIFFILTAVKITQIKRQTLVLKSRESATHRPDGQNNEKQRLLLYLKLFLVMGINWLLEVISAIYPEADYLWCVTDAYNVLIGFIVFVIFVCKRKIFRLMKKRLRST